MTLQPMRSACLSRTAHAVVDAKSKYKLLTEAGQIFIPIEETSFAQRSAMQRDKFGFWWLIVTVSTQMPRTG